MLTSFRQILLDEMNEEDLKNLAEVSMSDPETEPEFVYDKLSRGEMVPWRAETSQGNSILLLEVRQKKTERILYVWYLAGKGVIGNGKYILDTIVEFAKLHNCDAIETLTSLSLGQYLSRPEAGFKIKHVFVRKELK